MLRLLRLGQSSIDWLPEVHDGVGGDVVFYEADFYVVFYEADFYEANTKQCYRGAFQLKKKKSW